MWLLIIHRPRASRICQYAAELAKIIVHGDLVAQTLLRRDEHAFRLPRLDSGARDSQQLCGDCDRHARQLSAPVLQQLAGGTFGHPAHQGPSAIRCRRATSSRPCTACSNSLATDTPTTSPSEQNDGRFVQSGHSDRRSPHVIDVGWPTRALKAAAIVAPMNARGPRSYTSQRHLGVLATLRLG